jgi:hypothetical protein
VGEIILFIIAQLGLEIYSYGGYMAGGYDGSVKIDTRIDERGFNAGMKKLSASAGNFGKVMVKALAGIAIGFVALVAVIAVVAAALVGVVVVVAKLGARMFEMLADSISHADAFYGTIQNLQTAFSELKGAFLAVFATLLNAVAPAIQIVVDWLIKALNVASMVVAALTGQKTAMQYVAGSMADAAASSERMAANAKKTEKAAKGQLAAFDEINVLQKKDEEPVAGVGGAGAAAGGSMQLQEVPVPEDYLKSLWEGFKTWLNDSVIKPIREWFKALWESLPQPVRDAFARIGEFFSGLWEKLVAGWSSLSTWFTQNVVGPLVGAFTSMITSLVESGRRLFDYFIKPAVAWFSEYMWPVIKNVIDAIGQHISSGFQTVMSVSKNISLTVAGVIASMMEVFAGLIQFITGVFTDDWEYAWAGLRKMFGGMWDGMKAVVKGTVNSIIDLVNHLLRSVGAGVNAVIKSLNSITIDIPAAPPFFNGLQLGVNIPLVSVPQIPRLATGAVVPAHANMLAMIGEGSKREIVTPEDLMRRIVQEEMRNNPQEVVVRFEGTMGELVRVMRPAIYREEQRVGKSLIVGGAA